LLAAAIDRCGSPVCVGLDPVLDKLPAVVRAGHSEPVEAIRAFSLGVIRAVAGQVPAIKFQSACYERYGAPGLSVLEHGIAVARELGLVAILDAKRGDIGISAEHYAAAAFGRMHADWLTVSPYLGPDTLEPYLAERYATAGKGIFVLVRTSNPGSDLFQTLPMADGRSVAHMMADAVDAAGSRSIGVSGLSTVGAVVGATKPDDAARLRARMPNAIFLVPGYGAQGGTAADIVALVRAGSGSVGTRGVLVTASRSVIYAFSEQQGGQLEKIGAADGWMVAVADSASTLASEIAMICR